MYKFSNTLPIALLLSIIAYVFLGYFTVRTDFTQLMALFGVLFVAYWLIYQDSSSKATYRIGITASILFRFILLFTIPNLSDDFFRFIWDGYILQTDISPFAYLPIDFMNGNYHGEPIAGLTPELYNQLNSPEYFSVYPPICQFIFWLGVKIFPTDIAGAIMVMKTCLFAFECGSIFLLHQILTKFDMPTKYTLLYALNPLVIVELVGNLHFEAAMIFFVLLAVYLLIPKQGDYLMQKQTTPSLKLLLPQQKIWLSAGAMALAVCSKLIPLIFLPFLIKRLPRRQLLWYYGVVVGITFICFFPFIDPPILRNLFSSVGLYFQTFEFNASVYYVLRWVGYEYTDDNLIATFGKLLSALVFVSILLWAFLEKAGKQSLHSAELAVLSPKKLLGAMFGALCIYFFLANIVHPWYICSLIALCVFTSFRFPILWSALIVMTYYTYITTDYVENLWIVGIEYGLVVLYLGWELVRYGRQRMSVERIEHV